MKYIKACLVLSFACYAVVFFSPVEVWAGGWMDPATYLPTHAEIAKHKAMYDDPRPIMKEFGFKQVLPPELYSRLTYDQEQMKSLWAELVGFRSPDVVGKIAPEIKPGMYSYKDRDKYPELKQIMLPYMYEYRFKPGGPPFPGNFQEFEIVPTRQRYWALPIAKATKANLGKTKLDNDGYLIPQTWNGGVPFPQPSGKFKAQEIMYNHVQRMAMWESNCWIDEPCHGYNKNLKRDYDGYIEARGMSYAGRTLMEPFGWYDSRARERGEFKSYRMVFSAPRDIAGFATDILQFLSADKANQGLAYIPAMRRVRKLSATDTQDTIGGQDAIYDDAEFLWQKLSKTVYPYKYELLEEREYLVQVQADDGSDYLTSQGLEFRNVKLERRPLYVVKLTQLDPNYVYKERIFYIDQEYGICYLLMNYDQKGKLYRVQHTNYHFDPAMGMAAWSGANKKFDIDHKDVHSTIVHNFGLPAFWKRQDVGIEGIVKGR